MKDIDYSLIIRNVLKLLPKQKAEQVDYDKLDKIVEKKVEEIASPSRRLLNSGGPTTRLGEISDVRLNNPQVGGVLKYDGQNWVSGEDSIGQVSSVNSKTGDVVLTTADIADSTDKRYVTENNIIKLASIQQYTYFV